VQAGTHGNTGAESTTRYIFFSNKQHRGKDIHDNKELPNRDQQLPGSPLTTKLPGTEQMAWTVVRHYHFSSQKNNNCNNLKVIL